MLFFKFELIQTLGQASMLQLFTLQESEDTTNNVFALSLIIFN